MEATARANGDEVAMDPTYWWVIPAGYHHPGCSIPGVAGRIIMLATAKANGDEVAMDPTYL